MERVRNLVRYGAALRNLRTRVPETRTKVRSSGFPKIMCVPQPVRVLDLGCGRGQDLAAWGVTASDKITGLDINVDSLAIAKRFPSRTYVEGSGECLRFEDGSFERVISAIALPYMNIQEALAEVHRVLVPGGGLSLSLHLPSFTISELVHNALPRPVPTLFRLYVIANGLWFHCTGRTVGFLNARTESFQTERGIRLALKRAGFVDPSFRRGTGPAGETWVVEAIKSKAMDPVAALPPLTEIVPHIQVDGLGIS
jgi:ubiquinone/menaquinone biosynthesis C-methylase UbiE